MYDLRIWHGNHMIQIIALIEVKDRTAFQEFEAKAMKIMAKYEGRLLAAFEPNADESSPSSIGELHYLQFPSIEAFKKYRSDPLLTEMTELRQQAISNITIHVSGKFRYYDN